MAKFSIEFVKADSFGVVPGSGWVIKENGKRLDWPMLTTREEAVADVVGFQREFRQLASDEASERRGLSRMNGEEGKRMSAAWTSGLQKLSNAIETLNARKIVARAARKSGEA